MINELVFSFLYLNQTTNDIVVCNRSSCLHIYVCKRQGLIGSALDHRSLPPVFESRRGAYLKGVSSLTSLHYVWRSLGPFSLYHVHRSGRKTSINQSINLRSIDDPRIRVYVVKIVFGVQSKLGNQNTNILDLPSTGGGKGHACTHRCSPGCMHPTPTVAAPKHSNSS